MNKKRLFFDFLQKHNALEAYKRSFKTTVGRRNVGTNEYTPLGGSFVWACTPEGHEYWKSLDEKWYCHFNSIKKKYHF
jgi:hypothetical protein